MVFVGLSWGNDISVLIDFYKEGVFINKDLKELFINEVLLKLGKNLDVVYVIYYGLGGRMNGLVDNLVFFCVFCYG